MNRKLSKKLASSLMAAAMLTTATTTIIPSTVSAGQLLGETSFDYKALPWHIVESSPANQDFAIEEGAFHVTIMNAVGEDHEKWDLQFRYRGLNFKKGHEYEVSFTAKSNRSGLELSSKIGSIKSDEEYFVLDGDEFIMGPHMDGQWGKVAKLSSKSTTYTGTFIPTKDIEGAEWVFQYADGTQYEGNAQEGDEIWFEEVSIECKTCDEDYGGGFPYTTGRDMSCMKDPDTMTDNGTMLNYISVNQLGYYPNLAKVATFGDNAGDILYHASKLTLDKDIYEFELVDAETDKVVYTGTSSKVFADKDSDDNVCKLDFSDYTTPGEYYLRIKDEKWRSFNFRIADDIYSDSSNNMLTNSLNYFYQNRSGISIEESYITSGDKKTLAHEGGHKSDVATVQTKWINEYANATEATQTYASSTIDASGGWYSSGDHSKQMVSGGISVWTLQNMYEMAIRNESGVEKFADGSGTVVVPEIENAVPDILDETAYELDWMAKMKVEEDEPTWGKYAGLYYHKLQDHKWTGLALRPYIYEEEWVTERIIKPPTFAATLNYAACAAQAARLWAPYDAEKAEKYLETAVEAYEAYETHWYEYDFTETHHPTLCCDCPKEELNETSQYAPMWHAKGAEPYADAEVKDDAYWAACELFVSASEMGNTELAEKFKKELSESKFAFYVSTRLYGGHSQDGPFTSFRWDETDSLGSLTLALHPELLSSEENEIIKDTIINAAKDYISVEEEQGYGLPYLYDSSGYNDPNSLSPNIIIDGYEYGSNGMVINNAIIMAYAYDLTKDIKYINGVTQAMDYLLGNNPLSFSYISGYGTYSVENPYHRYWSYELDRFFPKAPNGVLVSGPNAGLQDDYVRLLGFVPGLRDNPSQRCYVDAIEAWSTNSVASEWNAPLAWVVSFMQDEASGATENPDPTPSTTKDPTGGVKPTILGDVNTYNSVDIADAVLLKCYILNSSKYTISVRGKANADVQNKGNGINAQDALAILKYSLNLIDSFYI